MNMNRQIRHGALLAFAAALSLSQHALGQDTKPPAQQWPGRYPWTEADVHFMAGMISHHAQAIQMAHLSPTRAGSNGLRVLSARIINAQQDEIALLQQWLADRNQPVPEAKPVPMKMMVNGMEHEMLMPGMLSDEQMKELELASGAGYDRLFLTYMIQHHEGALTMVNQLNGTEGAGQDDTVFKMASDIFADQSTEVERMKSMLSTLPQR